LCKALPALFGFFFLWGWLLFLTIAQGAVFPFFPAFLIMPVEANSYLTCAPWAWVVPFFVPVDAI